MRTGATELLQQMVEEVVGPEAGGWWPDLIMATSLLALGDLRAQLPPAMRLIPCVLYMHENQVAYPFRTEHGAGGERDLQYPVTNLMSVLAADRVIWNSRWNLDSFCGGIGEVLSRVATARWSTSSNRFANEAVSFGRRSVTREQADVSFT